MCRSAVEEALDDKGISVPSGQNSDLYHKVAEALRRELLTDFEVSQAQGARIIARDALHYGRILTQTEAQVALSVTSNLLNFIAEHEPQIA